MWKQKIKDSLKLRDSTQSGQFINAIESFQYLHKKTHKLQYKNHLKHRESQILSHSSQLDIHPELVEEQIIKTQTLLSLEYSQQVVNKEKINELKTKNSLLQAELDIILNNIKSLKSKIEENDTHQSEKLEFLSSLKVSNSALNSEKLELTQKIDDLLLENQKVRKENNDYVSAMLKMKEDSMKKEDEIFDILSQLRVRENSTEDDFELIECEPQTVQNYQTRNIRVSVPHKLTISYKAHEFEGITMAYNTTGSVLLTTGNEKLLKTWDYLCGVERQSFSGASHAILSISVPESNDLVLAGSSSGEGYIWNSYNMKLKHKLNGHVNKINGTGFIKYGREAVTGAEDRTIKFWDVTRGYCTKSIQVQSVIYSLSVYKEDSSIITGHKDGNIMVLYPKTSKLTKLAGETSAISGSCFSPCGNYFACLTRNNKIIVRDMRMMEVLTRLSHKNFLCPGIKTGISFSLDSKFLTCGSFNGNIYTWRLDGSCDSILHAGEKPVLAVEWNPNESQLASLDYSGCLSVWA